MTVPSVPNSTGLIELLRWRWRMARCTRCRESGAARFGAVSIHRRNRSYLGDDRSLQSRSASHGRGANLHADQTDKSLVAANDVNRRSRQMQSLTNDLWRSGHAASRAAGQLARLATGRQWRIRRRCPRDAAARCRGGRAALARRHHAGRADPAHDAGRRARPTPLSAATTRSSCAAAARTPAPTSRSIAAACA